MGSREPSNEEVIDDLMDVRIRKLSKCPCAAEADLPFIIADTSEVFEQQRRWTRALLRVHPFYG